MEIIKINGGNDMKEIFIDTEYIKLDSFLKFAGVISNGSDAKFMISNERIKVNDEVAFQRGKKLRDGDIVLVDNKEAYILKIEG
jgi:ribosome-associated protein